MVIELTHKEIMKSVFIAVSRTYFKEIVQKTPGTGMVADGWDIDIEKNNVVVYNEESGLIIKFLEEGTGLYGPKKAKYEIKPKNKKYLRWKVGPGDQFAFAKKVMHPGIKARRFIQKILDNPTNQNNFDKELEKAIKRILIKKRFQVIK